MKRTFTSLDELEGAVGEQLGPSDWFEVDQERVNAFADATEDHQWIHVDVERATAGPFGAPIVHGFLTLSLLPYLGEQIQAIDFGSARINYGLNRVRFMTPVPVGSRIRAAGQVSQVNRADKRSQIVVTYTIEIEGVERPACVAEQITLVLP